LCVCVFVCVLMSVCVCVRACVCGCDCVCARVWSSPTLATWLYHITAQVNCMPRHNSILTLHPACMGLNLYLLHTCACTYTQSTNNDTYMHTYIRTYMRANVWTYHTMHASMQGFPYIHKHTHTKIQRIARLFLLPGRSAASAQQDACALYAELYTCWPGALLQVGSKVLSVSVGQYQLTWILLDCN